nr:uncharacterized protein LOC129260117 [Lytechinus pictus]
MDEQGYGEIVCFLTTKQFPERITGKEPAQKYRLAQNAFRKRIKKYELCDEKLFFRKGMTRLKVVQASEREQLFREFHDSPSGGHGGLNVTFKKISQRYYWRGLMSYLKFKVKQCQVCQNRELWPNMNLELKEQRQGKRKTSVKKTAGGKANSPLTTHVLDTARGSPAANLRIEAYYIMAGQWKKIAEGQTNSDGRCPGLLTTDQFLPGVYKLYFDTGSYFTANDIKGFYPFVEIVFEIEDVNQHYHVPLLLSPFSYSTYRGS